MSSRPFDNLRSFSIEYNTQAHAEGSVLMRMGNTHVLCAVTVEEKVPPFLVGKGKGWITAEYGMLPRATHTRGRREAVSGRSGRTHEIQRLIGRSLRMMVDLKEIDGLTLRIDCDVINADGGTRCASITGAALAVQQALQKMTEQGKLSTMPSLLPIAAVSVGVVQGKVVLDLDYHLDSTADVDANFIMSNDGRWIEIQSTAEGKPFEPELFPQMSSLAWEGIQELFTLWK
ncbi:MAG: ribonuclease PH [Gammaproteobacteria bacterium]|nr:ribonuclease PH [Gammaproteobacteria bacterium]